MLPYRVLIVEDQAFQREYLKSLFKDLGVHRLVAVEDGAAALHVLRDQEFDLILSDLMMPGLDGVQFIQKLSEIKNPPRLALISSLSRRLLGGAGMVAASHGLCVIDQISKPALPATIEALIGKLRNEKASIPAVINTQSAFDRSTLLQAFENGHIQAWFQPKRSLTTGSLTAAEALVRWIHPELGVLLPSVFMDAIERCSLDDELLELMVAETIGAQSRWREQGFSVPVSINLPAHLLDDRELPDRLRDLVTKLGGDPGQLCFELTENTMTRMVNDYYAGACRLRMKGFGLSMDDFGQGYSSVFNLVFAPFTELKIDRALVRASAEDEDVAAALEAIISLGLKLGLNIVAEGVENHQQLALMRKMGCHMAQGFFISKAVSVGLFGQLLCDECPHSRE